MKASPSTKQLFLHVGMTKAGSTSIQNAMAQHVDYLETCGVCYPLQDKVFVNNHHSLYSLAFSNDGAQLAAYLHRALDAADEVRVKKIVMSCEDLFTLPFHEKPFELLINAIRNIESLELRIILVARHPRTWIRSHVAQLIANGAFAIDEHAMRYMELAEGVAKCTRSYFAVDPELILIPYQAASAEGLVQVFMRSIGVKVGPEGERKDNQTQIEQQFLSAEVAIGLICGLQALNCGIHPNSSAVDKLRESLRNTVKSCYQNEAVLRMLNEFEAILNQDIQTLTESALSRCTAADLELLDGLQERYEYTSVVNVPASPESCPGQCSPTLALLS